MEVLVSGQAATFASIKPPAIYRLDDERVYPIKSFNLGRAFEGCNDVQRIVVDTIEQARRACEESWAKDRSLRCLISCLDPEESRDDRFEFAAIVEELLNEFGTQDYLLDQMFCAPLPQASDLDIILLIKDEFPGTSEILERAAASQEIIRQVYAGLQLQLNRHYSDRKERASVFELLADAGVARAICDAQLSKANIDLTVLQWIAKFRHVDGIRPMLEAWTAGVRSAKRKIIVQTETDSSDEEAPSSGFTAGRSGRRAFEAAMRQQAAIIARLKVRDIEGARSFVRDLLTSQRLTSSAEHLGKSLSRLAHEAKILGVPELQIEWSEQAVLENPADPLTFAHLTDALISASRFNEAETAIASMQSLGHVLSAKTARARILRMTGRLTDARAAYLAAAEAHADEPEVVHALAGAAEVLRDMDRLEEALAEYTQLTNSYPLDCTLWCGRASVLMEMGRFAEAIETFRVSEKHGATLVPKIGMASAHKRRGEFARALKIYSEVVEEFPNDPIALCGRADIRRAQGHLEAALADYEAAVDRSPFATAPLIGKIDVLKDLRRFDEAERVLDSAVQTFPVHAGLAALRAALLMRQSKFEASLQAYDVLIARFPFHTIGKKSRADVLRRIGRLDEALEQYEAILNVNHNFFPAKLARFSLMIEMGRAKDVLAEIPGGQPKSELEWQLYFLKAIATETLYGERAQGMFNHGIRNSPFAKQRRLFAAAFGRHRLLNKQFSKSLQVIEKIDGEVSNVIWLHALAASGRRDRAKDIFDRIVSTETNEAIVELTTEIASRYNVIALPATKSREWIFAAEQRQLLLEAA